MKILPVIFLCATPLLAPLALADSAGTGQTSSDTTSAPAADNAGGGGAGAAAVDTAITTKVKSVLMAEPGISSLGIAVTTHQGDVTLSGQVKTRAQMSRAIELASNVNGVHKVVSVLRVSAAAS